MRRRCRLAGLPMFGARGLSGPASHLEWQATLLAAIASYAPTTKIRLTPGESVKLELLRIADDRLGFSLSFHAKRCERRPELGSWQAVEKNGLLQLRAGADVRIVASTPGSLPVEYEAMPSNSYCSDSNNRWMTANLSIQPGLYRWFGPLVWPVFVGVQVAWATCLIYRQRARGSAVNPP